MSEAYRVRKDVAQPLARSTELLLDSSTYRARSLASIRLPGGLLSEMTFAL